MYYSTDGSTWTVSGVVGEISNCLGVAWNGSLWVAVGQGTNTITYSYDGINWIAATNATSSAGVFMVGGAGRCITWNGSLWIAAGSDSSGSAFATSSDGIVWKRTPGTIFLGYQCQGIASRQLLPYVGLNSVQSALTSVYSTSAPTKWATSVPATIGAAIDRMAALLYTLNSNTAIP
jgi:hypothetical protein